MNFNFVLAFYDSTVLLKKCSQTSVYSTILFEKLRFHATIFLLWILCPLLLSTTLVLTSLTLVVNNQLVHKTSPLCQGPTSSIE